MIEENKGSHRESSGLVAATQVVFIISFLASLVYFVSYITTEDQPTLWLSGLAFYVSLGFFMANIIASRNNVVWSATVQMLVVFSATPGICLVTEGAAAYLAPALILLLLQLSQLDGLGFTKRWLPALAGATSILLIGLDIWLPLDRPHIHDIQPLFPITVVIAIFAMVTIMLRQSKEQKHELAEVSQSLLSARVAQEVSESGLRVKDLFLSNISHEIRTPLSSILGMIGVLRESDMTIEQVESVETIRQSSEQMLLLVNDILDFSKIDSGNLLLNLRPFRLDHCVEDSLHQVEEEAGAKGLALGYWVSPDLIPQWNGDVQRIKQVLGNLLRNAVKYTQHGEVHVYVKAEPKLRADEEEKGTLMRFSIRDTGQGIRPAQRNRIFRSLNRLDSGSSPGRLGKGLGLAISKRLCHLMGGSIWADSDGIEGKGSVFHFTVRLTPHQVPSPGPEPRAKGMRFLVVEPNIAHRRSLCERLRTQGAEVVEAGSGLDAVKIVEAAEAFSLAFVADEALRIGGFHLDFAMRQAANGKAPKIVRLQSLTGMGGDTLNQGVRYAASWKKPLRLSILPEMLGRVFDAITPSEAGEENAEEPAKLRILIAEDNPVNQKVMVRMLDKLGHEIRVVPNGAEVLKEMDRSPEGYDAILLDIHMPVMDGTEAAMGVLHSRSESRRPQLIAMTTEALDPDDVKASPFDYYLHKPIRMEQLDRLLQDLAHAARSRQVNLS